MTAAVEEIIRPQPGPQEAVLASPADILVSGGQAGGGKTWGLLLEPTRHLEVPGFSGVIFRRTFPEIKKPGGLWDESYKLYPYLGGEPHVGDFRWSFPSGAEILFSHLQHEADKLSWMGAQVPFLGFDQGELFTESQFWYMLSRNRSLCGVRPYVRLTCNPDADSWLATFIAWWINEDTGYPIEERAGVLRWMVRVGDEIEWGDTREELLERFAYLTVERPDGTAQTIEPKSVTFIPSSIYDNPILLEGDPAYLGNLQALPTVERERLLHGNWKIRHQAGLVFNRGWFELVDAAPTRARRGRYWDKAGTTGAGDWTAGVQLAIADGIIYVEDVIRGQWAAGERERVIRQAAEAWPDVPIWVEQEGGSGGKDSVEATIRNLAGFTAYKDPKRVDKVAAAGPLAAQAQVGNVKLVRAPWNEVFLNELHAFPTKGVPDDQVDAASGCYNRLTLTPLLMVT